MAEVSRADIAAALTGLTVSYGGQDFTLTGYPWQPAALAVWQAWADWQSAEWLSRCVVQRTWSVYVILPAADAGTWTMATDSVLEPVRDALILLGQVPRVEPNALQVADQGITLPAVNFTLITS